MTVLKVANVWIETVTLAYAWLSRDRNDNNLGALVAAIRGSVPATRAETHGSLTSIDFPSADLLADSLRDAQLGLL